MITYKKNILHFYKKVILGINLFILILFATNVNAQTTCANALPITINGACAPSASVSDATQNAPNINTATCAYAATFRRERWYTFTVSTGTTPISIVASATGQNLYLQLISSSNNLCTGTLSQIACANANDANNSIQIETINTTLGNGTYFLKVVNVGQNNNMTLSNLCITAPPPNALCTNATTLPCSTSNLAGTTVGTNGSTSNGTGCSMSDYGVWYTFTGDGQQTTITSTAGSGYDHEMSISSGSCGSLTNIACEDIGLTGGNETYTFTTINGTTYYVYIAQYAAGNTTTGTFTISRTCTVAPTPPINDNCSGAISLTVNPNISCSVTTSGSILNATNSGITGSGCGGTADDDVWYSFVATNTTHYVSLLNITGSTTDLYHAVFSGASGCGTLGSALICSDPNSSTITGLTIGQTYYVQVYSWTSTTGQTSSFDICIGTPPLPPTNDNCSGAIALTVNPSVFCTSTTAGTIASATNSGITGSGCGGTADDDVWYSFVATNTTHYISLLNIAGSTTDLYHAVFSGASGCGTLGSALICSDPNSSTITGLTIGQTYYVQVYSWTSTTGQTSSFDICIGTPPPPPTNDNCSGAIALTVNLDTSCTTTTAGTIASATNSGITGSGCGGTANDDVWYSFVATNTTHYVSLLNISGSTTDLYHAVFSGASGCGTLGSALVCSDPNSSTITGLTIGQTYYVQVYSWTSITGQTSSFNICIGTPCNGNGPGTGTTSIQCPFVDAGGLGLNGANPAPIDACVSSTCVDLEANYLRLNETTNYNVEAITYAPPYQFNCLQNPVSVNIDDVWSPTVTLPFDFCFYGNNYNQCLIGSNGVITFDLVNNSPGGGCAWSFSNDLPNTSLFLNTIFGVYHDIDPSIGGNVGWELVTVNNGCRALVASWDNIPMFSSSCNSILYTGMIVLYENTNIIEVYIEEKNVCSSWNSGNAVVGIQNIDGTQAVVAPNRNSTNPDWTVTNEAWRFTPSGPTITSLIWYEGAGVTGPIVGTNNTISVCPTSTTIYTAETTHTLCNGTTVTNTEQTTVTINNSKVWNGSVSTDWNNPSNWTPNTAIPTSSDCVIIPNTSNDPIVSGSGYNALGSTLSILNNAHLTINSNSNITLTNWINVQPNATFTLHNNANLVQINNVSNTGNIIYNRNASVRNLDYVYWSSPVANYNVNNIALPLSLGPIYIWDTVLANPNGGQGYWVSAVGNTMIAGKGYIARAPSSFSPTVASTLNGSFVGVPNNGTLTVPIYRGSDTNTSYHTGTNGTQITNFSDNWNLVGNPYPSSIRGSQFLFNNNSKIEGNINLWTHGTLPAIISSPFYDTFVYNYTPGDYFTYNFTGSSCCPSASADLFIGAGQGFFIQMRDGAASSDFVTFDNTLRNASYDNSFFFRTSSATLNSNQNIIDIERHRIWLDIIDNSQATSRTLIGYIEGATMLSDSFFDANTSISGYTSIYSLIDDSFYNIQGRALPFNSNDEIPIGIHLTSNGSHTIAIAGLDGLFNSQDIYLKDEFLNIYHNLKDSPYQFTSNSGTYNNRFKIVYQTTTLSNSANDFNNNVIVYSNENININSNFQTIKSIFVYDILGRKLKEYNNINLKNFEIKNLIKNNSSLLISILLEDGNLVSKKIIY